MIVLEAEPALTIDLRAGSYHPPTIEMLDELGIADRMHETGIVVPRWQIRDRIDGVVAEFDLSLLRSETRYPYRLHLEQHRLTQLLLERIREATNSVEILFSRRASEVDQDADGVTVKVGTEALRGSFAIGCDGARSIVRQTMGVEFEGFTWPERYLATSTIYDLAQLGFTGAGYIADPVEWAAVFHVPDDGPPGLWRVVYPIKPDEEDAAALQVDRMQSHLFRLLESAEPKPQGGRFPLRYASVYRVHQRVASCFVKDRFGRKNRRPRR